MVIDALTVIKAYLNQEKHVKIEQFGRFEAWSHFVREPLVWLGCKDPLETVKKIEADDPVRLMHTELLEALCECWPLQRRFRTKHVAKPWFDVMSRQEREARDELYEVLETCIQSPSGVNSRTVAQLFKKLENCIYEGMKLVKAGIYNGNETWKVEIVREDEETDNKK